MANNTAENRSINRRVEILVVGLDVSEGGGPPPPAANGVEEGADSAAQDVVVADGQSVADGHSVAIADTPAEEAGGSSPGGPSPPDGAATSGSPADGGSPDGSGAEEATVAPPPGEDIRPFPEPAQISAASPGGQTPLATILGQ